MNNYNETSAESTSWLRANRFELLNGYGAAPQINITEEMIVSIGGLTLNKFTGVLVVPYSPTGTINLYNPNTGEVVGTMSHNEIMTIMYSIYRDAAEKRDSQV